MQYGTHRSACEETMLPDGCPLQRLAQRGSERAIPARFCISPRRGLLRAMLWPKECWLRSRESRNPAHCRQRQFAERSSAYKLA